MNYQIFVDQISVWSLIKICIAYRKPDIVWYFERITPISRLVVRLLTTIKLIDCPVSKIENNIGDIRDESNQSLILNLLNEARGICSLIRKQEFERNPLINALSKNFNRQKLLLHFEKTLEPIIYRECLRISLAAWKYHSISDTQVKTPCILLTRRNSWIKYLFRYSRDTGISCKYYRSPALLNLVSSDATKLIVLAFLSVTRYPLTLIRKMLQVTTKSSIHNTNIKIGLRYWYRTLSLDPGDRSEFFWIDSANISKNNLVLFNYVSDTYINPEIASEITRNGISIFGKSPDTTNWSPRGATYLKFIKSLVVVISVAINNVIHTHTFPLQSLTVFRFLWDYYYWHDFFAANNIRINVGTIYTPVPQVLAMDHLGGVSASYQFSISNILYPTTALNGGEDIQFIFSNAFKELWSPAETPPDYFVETGFIYDRAIPYLKNDNRHEQIRNVLKQHGADFIICFFDENSGNTWENYSQNSGAIKDYTFLLEWLLNDDRLGVIFKPKNSLTLFDRIDATKTLFERAQATGRCSLLMSDNLNGNIYPTEAALAADLCIGKLGTTAALESALAGAPTLFIDTEGFRNNPFYKWAREHIVFNSWEELQYAVTNDKNINRDIISNWEPYLTYFDPFRDGKSSYRMAYYIQSIHHSLNSGASKIEALSFASSEFRKHWPQI